MATNYLIGISDSHALWYPAFAKLTRSRRNMVGGQSGWIEHKYKEPRPMMDYETRYKKWSCFPV